MGVEHTGRDTLDTTTTSETSDSWLGNALDVVTKNLPVSLGAALAEALATFAAYTRMSEWEVKWRFAWGDSRPVIFGLRGVGLKKGS